MQIAYKESRETGYWLRLLHDTGYLTGKEFQSIHPECEELQKLLGSIQHSATLNSQLENS